MKLSQNTLNLLKNYMSINDSIILSPGNRLETRAIQGSFLSWATIEEDLPALFPMHKLSDFIAAMSLFDDPDLEFTENTCTISDAHNKVVYLSSNTKLVNNKPLDNKGLPDFQLSFNLSNVQLQRILKAAASLGHDWMIFSIGEESGKVELTTVNSKANKNNRNDFFTTLEAPLTNEFVSPIQAIFDVSLLKIIPGDYEISISKHGIAKLYNSTLDVVYAMGLLQKSTF